MAKNRLIDNLTVDPRRKEQLREVLRAFDKKIVDYYKKRGNRGAKYSQRKKR